jgi:hypothetical protein
MLCVKIWPFDVFVLFLKCVQFLKPCVQFLMDTILNLPMCLVSGEEKGRRALTRRVSHLSKRETHSNKACLHFT